MRFNIEHYLKYYKAAGWNEKDGFWDVLRFPNGKYCFATNQRLGDNGNISSHPLLGKKFKGTHIDKLAPIVKRHRNRRTKTINEV